MLRVDRLAKTFGAPPSGVDLVVAEGEFVCLLGPSGCGKSTLLNISESCWARAAKITDRPLDFTGFTWPAGLRSIDPKLVTAPPPPC